MADGGPYLNVSSFAQRQFLVVGAERGLNGQDVNAYCLAHVSTRSERARLVRCEDTVIVEEDGVDQGVILRCSVGDTDVLDAQRSTRAAAVGRRSLPEDVRSMEG